MLGDPDAAAEGEGLDLALGAKKKKKKKKVRRRTHLPVAHMLHEVLHAQKACSIHAKTCFL